MVKNVQKRGGTLPNLLTFLPCKDFILYKNLSPCRTTSLPVCLTVPCPSADIPPAPLLQVSSPHWEQWAVRPGTCCLGPKRGAQQGEGGLGSACWLTPRFYTSLVNPQPHSLQVGKEKTQLLSGSTATIVASPAGLMFGLGLSQDRSSYKLNSAATAAFPCKRTEQRNL